MEVMRKVEPEFICQVTPLYLGQLEAKIFAQLHLGCNDAMAGTVTLICPPLGVDYMNSHRAVRQLANAIAATGQSCLRLDYFNSGNSADLDSPDDLENYLESVRQAHKYLLQSGFQRINLVGIKSGALIAGLAAQQLNIDSLVFWSPVIQGKTLLREIRALQMASPFAGVAEEFEAGGLLFNDITAGAFKSVDLALGHPQCHRALVVASEPNKKLQGFTESWQQTGINIEMRLSPSLADIFVDAHETQIPHDAIALTSNWLGETPQVQAANKISLESDPATNILEGENYIESCHYTGDKTSLFYIHCKPLRNNQEPLPAVLMFNAGANHQVGPNRLYVKLSRQLAELGFDCYRCDLPGLGESVDSQFDYENLPYMPEPTRAIAAMIKSIGEQKVPPVILGLCSGAFHGFKAAAELPGNSLTQVVAINPLTFYWEQGMTINDSPTREYKEWNWYMQSLKRSDQWKKLLTGKVKILPAVRSVGKRVGRSALLQSLKTQSTDDTANNSEITDDTASSLDKIQSAGTFVQFIFSRNDPGFDILNHKTNGRTKKFQKRGVIDIRFIEDADHTFSMNKPRQELIQMVLAHFQHHFVKDIVTSHQ